MTLQAPIGERAKTYGKRDRDTKVVKSSGSLVRKKNAKAPGSPRERQRAWR